MIKPSNYKKDLRKYKISHKTLALYTGLSREHTTLLLLDKANVPIVKMHHITKEIEMLIHIIKINLPRKTTTKHVYEFVNDFINLPL